MDFYFQAGKMALGSRLRRLSEKFTDDAAAIYALYDVTLDPKWFPVFYVLAQTEEASITEIAHMIGHSHPSVSQIVKEMDRNGLTLSARSAKDARVNVVKLSDAGKQLIPKLETQCGDVTQAVDELLTEAQHDLWKAIEEMEFLLTHKRLCDRVRAQRKAREQHQVEIIDYRSEFHADFKRLNCEWIEAYFTLEDADNRVLDDPDNTILQPGGHIVMARYHGEIVGTCALIKLDDETYELAKMAVTEKARGLGIGWLLGQAMIHKARERGATTILLESNTVLEPAIKLYQKLGFKRVVGQASSYKRCNIHMELRLVPTTSQ